MSDVLRISNLIVEGVHGFYPEEEQQSQRFKIDIDIIISIESAIQSDDIVDSVDWKSIKDEVVSVVENQSFRLVESLAAAIVEVVFHYEKVEATKVSVAKLDIWKGNGFPSVTISRKKEDLVGRR